MLVGDTQVLSSPSYVPVIFITDRHPLTHIQPLSLSGLLWEGLFIAFVLSKLIRTTSSNGSIPFFRSLDFWRTLPRFLDDIKFDKVNTVKTSVSQPRYPFRSRHTPVFRASRR